MQSCISSVRATVLNALGMNIPGDISSPVPEVGKISSGCTKAVIYNPDAVAWWVYEKYHGFFTDAEKASGLSLKMTSVMPSVTPVCFASMYSGVMPETHGIRKYEKPVLTVQTLFDDFVKAGKKAAIVSTAGDSISKIFLNRNIDYYIYPSLSRVNRKAKKLIKENRYDLIVIYNGNYDSTMHKKGPEHRKSLKSLTDNLKVYCEITELIKKYMPGEKVLYGFCPDHGCHEIDGGCGSHGLDCEEDMNVIHLYGVKEKI